MKKFQPRSNQQGSALVVGLIVLLVMTLLGISSMGSTTLELKMANNLQTGNFAYQSAVATSSLITDSDSTNADVLAIQWDSVAPQSIANLDSYNVNTGGSVTGTVSQTATITYRGCMNVVEGFEISGSDQSGGSSAFKGLVHEIDVTATVTSVTGTTIGEARSLDGVQTVRPGCPTT